MSSDLIFQFLVSAIVVSAVGTVTAQTLPSSDDKVVPSVWIMGVEVEDVAIGQGLPVLSLDRPDWPNLKSNAGGTARASRSLRAELTATHPTGWRLATLVRSEAWLAASEDAVLVAALDATQADPLAQRNFVVDAHGLRWQGQGIRVGTPWWPVSGGQWRWQADAQILNLKKLRVDDIAGNIFYSGAGAYDFNLHGQRSNVDITGPFLPVSGADGFGASLSIAAEGDLLTGVHLSLQAKDLFSQLQWKNMATDASVLNSQVTSRAPDGSLNYASVLNGRMALLNMNERIGTHWIAQASWALSQGSDSGALTARAEHKAGISQTWFGWDGVIANESKPRLTFEVEPKFKALSAALAWGGWRAVLASDGKGDNTEYRRWMISWHKLH